MAGVPRAACGFVTIAAGGNHVAPEYLLRAASQPPCVNAATDGYGLWTDAIALTDRIFTDGFD